MRPYKGDYVDLEVAREKWKPGENRIRVPVGIKMDEFDEIVRIGDLVGASDITFQVGEPVWFEIHNRWTPVTTRALGRAEMENFLAGAYDPIGFGEVVQRGRPIDHAYVVHPHQSHDGDRKIRIRLNATGGRDPQSDSSTAATGIQASCRVLPGMPPRLTDMNVEPELIDGFKVGPGLTLVTGPTGSGKTTLLGGAVRGIGENPENSIKIVEYSAPVELIYDECTFPNSFIHQLEVGRAIRLRPEEGGTAGLWAACVANAMRRKPGMILIGEARDAPTIEGCVTAAMTGHGVMSTMHTIGVAETLRRAIMALPADQRASIAIDLMEMSSMYVTQLLVPRVGGGRCAVREYIKFDAQTRRKIIAQPIEAWTGMIQTMMLKGEVELQRMIDAAQKAHKNGLISDYWLGYLSARQREFEKEKPVDLAAPPMVAPGSATGSFTPEADENYSFDKAAAV